MAIRWKDFPHKEIFADIHSRLNQNAVERTADDSLRHILRRRLHFLIPDEHSRFIQLESRHIVERLRCTRDAYRAFTDAQGCSPASEAYWVILRFSVLPTAVASLQRSVVDYARLTRVPGADLSLLFGILTEACHVPRLDGKAGRLDFDDRTPATNTEIQGLAGKVSEDTLLWLEDHRVGHPFGDGPFAADDASSIHRSWALCALPDQMTLIDWMPVREKLWRACVPWTEGLATLVGCVQDELLSQCFALSPDGQVRELRWKQQSPEFESVVVPEPTNQFIKVAGAWTVTFMGNTVRLPANIVGLDYVSAILRCEGRPIGALELLHVAGGHANSHAIENALDSLREEMDETDEGEAVVHSDLQQQDFTRDAILDDVGRKRLQARQDELEKQTAVAIEVGDTNKAHRVQDEYDQIERERERSCNIYGRPRIFGSENEKARVSITQALRRAYAKIRVRSPPGWRPLKVRHSNGLRILVSRQIDQMEMLTFSSRPVLPMTDEIRVCNARRHDS